jgi:hypothetical protein
MWVAGSAPAAAWTAVNGSIINNGFADTTVDFSPTITTASTDTFFVFVANENRNITGVTVGGDAMTEAVDDNDSGDNRCSIWYRVGAYTNPTVTVTADIAVGRVGASFGKWTGASATPSATAALAFGFRSDPHQTGSLTVASGGLGLAVAMSVETINFAAPMTDGDTASDGSPDLLYRVAHTTTAGSFTPTCNTDGFAGLGMCALVIGP